MGQHAFVSTIQTSCLTWRYYPKRLQCRHSCFSGITPVSVAMRNWSSTCWLVVRLEFYGLTLLFRLLGYANIVNSKTAVVEHHYYRKIIVFFFSSHLCFQVPSVRPTRSMARGVCTALWATPYDVCSKTISVSMGAPCSGMILTTSCTRKSQTPVGHLCKRRNSIAEQQTIKLILLSCSSSLQ